MAIAEKETLGFQAEVKQLLQLMIHSLYSNKEIFLRELISNASDASDKLRFEAINNDALYGNDHELRIKVTFDKAARTITISDNGIGMSRDEVISHLGTIAKSGTKEFFGKLSGDQQADAALIGQFGVGFYSGFIVADKITVETRRAGLGAADGVRWESSGEGDYSVEAIEKTSRGTDIILHLREGEDELLSSWKLKSIIRKYSDHITIPIVMKGEGDNVVWVSPLDETPDTITLHAGNKRPHLHTVVIGQTNFDGTHRLNNSVRRLFDAALFDINAGGSGAVLAGIDGAGESGDTGYRINIDIIKDDKGGFTTQFQMNPFEGVSSRFHNFLASAS